MIYKKCLTVNLNLSVINKSLSVTILSSVEAINVTFYLKQAILITKIFNNLPKTQKKRFFNVFFNLTVVFISSSNFITCKT